MSLLSNLRVIVLLRRIAIAVESIAQSQSCLATLAREAEERRISGLHPRSKRGVEIGAFDPKEASQRWRQQKLQEGWTEEELEEEYGQL